MSPSARPVKAHFINSILPVAINTFRSTLLSKRTIASLLFMAIPLIISIVWFFKADDFKHPLQSFSDLFDVLYLHFMIPLVTLIMAIDMFHSDIKDRTVSYLLIRPVPKPIIYIGKYLGLVMTQLIIVCIPVLMMFFLMISKGEDLYYLDDLLGFMVIMTCAVLVYTVIFAFLGILLKHPLMLGLGIAFIWEALISNFGKTVPRFTVMYYLRGIGHQLIDVRPYTDLPNQASVFWLVIPLLIIFLLFAGLGMLALQRKQLY